MAYLQLCLSFNFSVHVVVTGMLGTQTEPNGSSVHGGIEQLGWLRKKLGNSVSSDDIHKKGHLGALAARAFDDVYNNVREQNIGNAMAPAAMTARAFNREVVLDSSTRKEMLPGSPRPFLYNILGADTLLCPILTACQWLSTATLEDSTERYSSVEGIVDFVGKLSHCKSTLKHTGH